jgi:hypothetical protein
MNFSSGTLVAGFFALCTAMFWGTYGPILSKGHHLMEGGGRLRPFICVGFAYFLVAIVGPIVVMYTTGHDKGGGLLSGWTFSGIIWSTIAGGVGALGAFTLIMALAAGGIRSPIYVMPIVFGCAPVVSAFTTMYLNKSFGQLKESPFFAAGLLLVATGAITVLLTAPKPKPQPASDHSAKPAPAKSVAAKQFERKPVEIKPQAVSSAEAQAVADGSAETNADWQTPESSKSGTEDKPA